MLEPEYRVAGVLPDGSSVLVGIARLKPDVLLLDLSLPKRSGMDVLADVVAHHPGLPVVIVTMHLDPVLADLALDLGARAFVPKDAGLAELRTAIEEARAGRRFRSPRIPKKMHQVPIRLPLGFQRLTPREQEILRRVGHNETSDQMALSLGVSTWTIHFHRKNILRKLELHGERAMIRYAMMVNLALSEDPDSIAERLSDLPC